MPLMVASLEGHGKISELLLLDDRVRVDAEDISGETAVSLAWRRGDEEMVRLLESHASVANG